MTKKKCAVTHCGVAKTRDSLRRLPRLVTRCGGCQDSLLIAEVPRLVGFKIIYRLVTVQLRYFIMQYW